MTLRQIFKCANCSKRIALRIQLGYRAVEPVNFLCPGCQQRITADLHLDPDRGVVKGFQNVAGAKTVTGPKFDYVVNHVPDFPVEAGSESDANVSGFVGAFSRADDQVALIERARRQQLFVDIAAKDFSQIERMIHNYLSGRWDHFRKAASKFSAAGTNLDNPLARNSAITLAMEWYLAPIVSCENHVAAIREINEWIASVAQSNKPAFEAFITEAAASGYLRRTLEDGLELYLRIFGIADDVRQVLVEWDCESPDKVDIPHLRVTGHARFDTVKSLYVDAYEFLSRSLTLVMALENIEARGNHNKFAAHPSNKNFKVASLADFHGKPHAPKGEMTASPFGKMIASSLEPKLRNGIGHYAAKLNIATGMIQYSAGGAKTPRVVNLDYGSFLLRILRLLLRVQECNQMVKFLCAYAFGLGVSV